MSETVDTTKRMVRRFKRSTYTPDDCTYDILYTDRLTGRVVLRYDGADPANTNPAYGGISDREMLRNRDLDIDEEIEIERSVVPVNPAEVADLIQAKHRQAMRQKEEEAAKNLMTFLGSDARSFNFEHWRTGEQTILKPALEKKGYTNISFYMIDEDSFGPLIRGVRSVDPDGNPVRFFYG